MGLARSAGGSRRSINVVLVGERTPDNESRVAAMETRGWRVVFTNPAQLFMRLLSEPPAAVVLDQGARSSAEVFALATRVKGEARVPVIVLTKLQMPGIAAAAQRAGCVCISLPCRASSVVASVLSAVAMMGGPQWRMRPKTVNPGAPERPSSSPNPPRVD